MSNRKVKLRVYTQFSPIGKNGKQLTLFTDKGGNTYAVFYNFDSDAKYPLRYLIDKMMKRLTIDYLKGKHTGGKFYDAISGEEIASFRDDGILEYYI